MLQSCEILITKMNKWQEAILELEKLAEEFLDTGNKEILPRIENQKKEVEKYSQEYLDIVYDTLPYGQEIFWPEKDLLENFLKQMNRTLQDFVEEVRIQIKKRHVTTLYLGSRIHENSYDLSQFRLINLSAFQALEDVEACGCNLSNFPKMPQSIESIDVGDNPHLDMSSDLSELSNLKTLTASNCNFQSIPRLPKSIKEIYLQRNTFSEEDKEKIKAEYPNASIVF